MLKPSRTLLGMLVLLLLVPRPARAQTSAAAPSWTLAVSAGRANDTGSGDLFAATKTRGSNSGVAFDVSGRATGRFGLVAEFGLFDAASVSAGARWMPVSGRRARVFVHLLAGPVLITLETTAFAVQPGAGVDVRLSSAVGLRLQADYRRMTWNGHQSHQLRAVAGLVFSSRQ